MESGKDREAAADESIASGPGIDKLSQEWKNTKQPFRSTCCGIHSAVINTTSRASPRINQTPVRFEKSSNRIGLAETSCIDN
jgi:hypothetical protein